MTSFDYVELINLVAKNSAVCALYAQYICELALLQSDMGDYPQAKVAAASVLLARLSLQQGMDESLRKVLPSYITGGLNYRVWVNVYDQF